MWLCGILSNNDGWLLSWLNSAIWVCTVTSRCLFWYDLRCLQSQKTSNKANKQAVWIMFISTCRFPRLCLKSSTCNMEFTTVPRGLPGVRHSTTKQCQAQFGVNSFASDGCRVRFVCFVVLATSNVICLRDLWIRIRGFEPWSSQTSKYTLIPAAPQY